MTSAVTCMWGDYTEACRSSSPPVRRHRGVYLAYARRVHETDFLVARALILYPYFFTACGNRDRRRGDRDHPYRAAAGMDQ